MEITILGCHSASPRANARPSAQLLEMRGHLFLIDCGEATQIALRNANAKFARIKHIFISHLHGDHFFGLFGLISTFQLLGREAEMHIYGPKGIKEAVLLVLKLGGAYTPFPLYFHELTGNTSELLYEDEKVSVRTIPLQHRVYTNGFLFEEKVGERLINADGIAQYPEIQVCDYQNIKNGKDIVLEDGTTVPNAELTFEPHRPQSYAYCSDTLYFEALADSIRGARVVYHESTFLQVNEELAAKTMHSTAQQAGLTARNVGAEELFKKEAEEVFKNVFLAEDGKKFVFN